MHNLYVQIVEHIDEQNTMANKFVYLQQFTNEMIFTIVNFLIYDGKLL